MKKIKFALVVGLVVLLAAMFVACDLGALIGGSSGDTGTLVIRLTDAVSKSLNWEPAILMEIKSYVISGQRKGGSETFGPITPDSDPYTVSDLKAGVWEVTVLGKNEDGDAIGECVADVEIQAGKTKEKTFVVKEYSGIGTLDVTVSWEGITVTDPHIRVYAAKDLDEVDEYKPVSMTINGTTATGSLNNLEAGYYHICLSLYDGDPDNNDATEKVREFGSIRIVQGQTTEVTYDFDEGVIIETGGLGAIITQNMPIPFSVSLSRSSASYWPGRTDVTFTVEGGKEGDTNYWFVDGNLQGEEVNGKWTPFRGSEFTLDVLPQRSIGVTVQRGEVLASAHSNAVFYSSNPTQFVLDLDITGIPDGKAVAILNKSIPHYRYVEKENSLDSVKEGVLACRKITYTPRGESGPITTLYPVAVLGDYILNDGAIDSGGGLCMIFGFEVADLNVGDGVAITHPIIIFDNGEGIVLRNDTLTGDILTITEIGEVGGLFTGRLEGNDLAFAQDGDGTVLVDMKLDFSFVVEEALTLD